MNLGIIKKALPWWAKIAAKILLARLPLPYGLWKKLGLFEHGQMQSIEYAQRVFNEHLSQVNPPQDFVGLELGPGDSLLSAIVARQHGAQKIYMVDAGDFANKDIDIYKLADKHLSENKGGATQLDNAQTLVDVLQVYNAEYLTEGLASLKKIESNTVDFVWSQAVLEHVREHEFLDSMKEIQRILKTEGKCSHSVDLKDHLGGALNNLRFSAKVWESDFMTSSGFYTNRIRYSEMISLFEQAGFEVDVLEQRKWEALPTPLNKINSKYRELGEQELLTQGFTVLLSPVKV